MDDAVGVRGRFFQPVKIFQAAATHCGTERGQGLSGGVRPGQAGDVVSGGDEFGDDVGTGMAGSASDENMHVAVLLI